MKSFFKTRLGVALLVLVLGVIIFLTQYKWTTKLTVAETQLIVNRAIELCKYAPDEKAGALIVQALQKATIGETDEDGHVFISGDFVIIITPEKNISVSDPTMPSKKIGMMFDGKTLKETGRYVILVNQNLLKYCNNTDSREE